ncbi:hypothetical protein Chor_016750 [Crotalus horridus]
MIKVFLVTTCLAVFPYQRSSIILESGNINDYEVVYPQKVTALPKGAVQQPEQKYEDIMKYEFKVNGKPVVLHLEKNKGLFSEDYSETHYSPDDREITTNPLVEDHCYYHGHIQNDADSTQASVHAMFVEMNFWRWEKNVTVALLEIVEIRAVMLHRVNYTHG